MDQKDPEPPEPSYIKEEQEKLWISQEEKQLQGLEEDHDTKFPLTAESPHIKEEREELWSNVETIHESATVAMKSEGDEGKPQSSQLHQIQTDQQIKVGEDCGGSEPADPVGEDNSSVSLESESEDSDDDSSTTRNPESHSNGLKKTKKTNNPHSVVNVICVVCGKKISTKGSLYNHMSVHKELKSFICPICGEKVPHKQPLLTHMRSHNYSQPLLFPILAKTLTAKASASRSSALGPFHKFTNQHPDIEICKVTQEDHLMLLRMSQERPDRYGCLLFRFVTPEEKYRAWCITTNWDGSRGKWELPRNLKVFLVHTLRQRFSQVLARDEKMMVDRINEVLRTPCQFAMGLIC